MKQTRLDELNEKIKNSEISIIEVAEIVSATLESSSRHSKEIKLRLSSIEENLNDMNKKLDKILNNLSPAFGVVIDDEED